MKTIFETSTEHYEKHLFSATAAKKKMIIIRPLCQQFIYL